MGGSVPVSGLSAVLRTLQASPPGSLFPRDWLLAELAAASAEAGGEEPLPALLTLKAVAARYGRSVSRVRELAAAGALPGAFRLGGTGAWRIPPSALAAFERAPDAVHDGGHARRADSPASLRPGQAVGDWRKARRRPAA